MARRGAARCRWESLVLFLPYLLGVRFLRTEGVGRNIEERNYDDL